MFDTVVVCPSCGEKIKLTESLAAPVVAAIKQEYEKKLAEKDTEVSEREAALREQEKEVATARAQVNAAIDEGIRRERQTIAGEEAKKARLLVSDELDEKSRDLADLEQVIAAKDESWPKHKGHRLSCCERNGSWRTPGGNSISLWKSVCKVHSALSAKRLGGTSKRS